MDVVLVYHSIIDNNISLNICGSTDPDCRWYVFIIPRYDILFFRDESIWGLSTYTYSHIVIVLSVPAFCQHTVYNLLAALLK